MGPFQRPPSAELATIPAVFPFDLSHSKQNQWKHLDGC